MSTVQSWTWQPQSCVPGFLSRWNIQSVRSHKLDFSIRPDTWERHLLGRGRVKSLEFVQETSEIHSNNQYPPLRWTKKTICRQRWCGSMWVRTRGSRGGACWWWWWGRLFRYRYRSSVGGAGGYRKCEGRNILLASARSSRPTADWRFHFVLMEETQRHVHHGNNTTTSCLKIFTCRQRWFKTSLKQRCALEFSYLPDFFFTFF